MVSSVGWRLCWGWLGVLNEPTAGLSLDEIPPWTAQPGRTLDSTGQAEFAACPLGGGLCVRFK